jgi:hypothetical protein
MRLFMLREIYDITQNKYYFTCFIFCKDKVLDNWLSLCSSKKL